MARIPDNIRSGETDLVEFRQTINRALDYLRAQSPVLTKTVVGVVDFPLEVTTTVRPRFVGITARTFPDDGTDVEVLGLSWKYAVQDGEQTVIITSIDGVTAGTSHQLDILIVGESD